jgi:CheY-like chemotaxis protein
VSGPARGLAGIGTVCRMPPTVLLLEDDPAIARTAAHALQRDGFGVEHVLLVQQAAHRLATPAHGIALAILDVGRPDGSGLDLCRELRRVASALPIILLTARGEAIEACFGACSTARAASGRARRSSTRCGAHRPTAPTARWIPM